MQTLRNAHLIARFMLVWFALSIGVAIASPMVKPQGLQLVCSGSGSMKVIASDEDGNSAASGHTLDCPLCASISAPPPMDIVAFGSVAPQAYALPQPETTPPTGVGAAPPPARGPPIQS